MTIEAMKQALEALESCTPADTSTGHVVWPSYDEQAVAQAITALRTAIEQAEKQEPVAWEDVLGAIARGWAHPENARKPIDVQLAVAIAKEIQDMYTTPPAAQRQPLTDEAIWRQYQALWPFHPAEEPRLAAEMVTFARAIEAAHGIKGEA
jgi:hypothetical protein